MGNGGQVFPANRAMILLSVKAGLRACEIAGLDWSMVLDAQAPSSRSMRTQSSLPRMGPMTLDSFRLDSRCS
jgi:hypothetical protein